MSKRTISPLYLDGPLKGQLYETDTPYVFAMQYFEPTVGDIFTGSPFIPSKEVRYQMRKMAITVSDSDQGFIVWIAWCGPYNDPPLRAIIEQLYSKDAQERGEFVNDPRRAT